MITSALIYLAYYTLSTIIEVFPVSTGFPPQVATAFTFVGGYVGILDPLVPIDTLLDCILILITVRLIIFGFKVLSWVYGKVPFVGR